MEKIENEIMDSGDPVTFDDIAGLADAKQTVQEVVCWPMKRPDLFTGLRRAPNGLVSLPSIMCMRSLLFRLLIRFTLLLSCYMDLPVPVRL